MSKRHGAFQDISGLTVGQKNPLHAPAIDIFSQTPYVATTTIYNPLKTLTLLITNSP